MLEKRIGLADERQEFWQEPFWIRALEDVNVARADRIEVGDSHLALVGTGLPEENLARTNPRRECRAIRKVAPRPDSQIARFKVLQPDHALDASSDGVLA